MFKSVWSVEYTVTSPWASEKKKKYFSSEKLADDFASDIGNGQVQKGFARPVSVREIAVFVDEECVPLGRPVVLDN